MKKLLVLLLTLVLTVSIMGCSNDKEKAGNDKKETEKVEFTFYARHMDSQAQWFQENVIDEFNKKTGHKVTMKQWSTISDLTNTLELDKKRGTIGALYLFGEDFESIVSKDLLRPLSEFDDWSNQRDRFTDYALANNQVKGEEYFVPYKYDLYGFYYDKTAVSNAVAGWEKYQSEIEAALKEFNGSGLPNGYTLEKDPNEWDMYDLTTAGLFWRYEEGEGRLAHRAKDYEGTTNEILLRTYSMGGAPEDILGFESDRLVEAFEWEKFFWDKEIFNHTMNAEKWSGGGVWGGISQGKVYGAFMHVLDMFFIHGGSHPTMTGFTQNVEELGVAQLPAGAPIDLSASSDVNYDHTSLAFLHGVGVPKAFEYPEVAYEFIMFALEKERYLSESATFGMPPVLKSVYDDPTIYPEPWMTDIMINLAYKTEKTLPFPIDPLYPQISQALRNTWYNYVANEDGEDKSIQDYLKENKAN